jgi:hypothetical protein
VRAPFARLLIAIGCVAAGCGASDRPFDRVALIPSTWEIVTVSGAAVDGDPLPILAIGRSDSARVELRCGEIDLQYISDTDGAALSFGEQRVFGACQAPADKQDVTIRTAIGAVNAWRVLSDSTIEMLDQGGRAVLSLRMTSCDCPHQPPGTGAPTSS